ncbi:T9SS type B sorting domain-containing protein [Namhaeicola litoreus]|uniref:T9SS type B sorting domain-containing protein n=1 Tax=Namhaeicola litoreus TaxID=1052145 RepID=A0ABW3Y2Y8_9FLAO
MAQSDVATIKAEGNQAYCPTTEIPIVTDLTIFDPNNNPISNFYIQISKGYERGSDNLKLSNPSAHPNITTTSFDAQQGKIGLIPKSGNSMDYEELIAAVKDIVFWNSDPHISGERVFSLTPGSANYLPSTQHYYVYVAQSGITWKEAKVAAENSSYFGMKGYLATLTSREEALFAGEQATGVGWIGGSDEEVDGVWKWVTGPEAGTQFWQGLSNGSATAPYFYANWRADEPNDFGDGANSESYAHITHRGLGAPFGTWNDLPNQGGTDLYVAQGYVIEYGGFEDDPVLNLSDTTRIYIPKITEFKGDEKCGIGIVDLKASASSGEVYWFESIDSQTPIFIGDSYSPDLSESKTFYVLASEEQDCFLGKREEVLAVINPIPEINESVKLNNCDEDGNPDGFTNFNLDQAIGSIFIGIPSSGDPPAPPMVSFHYYLSRSDAENKVNEIAPSPFNNRTSNTVYCRVESNKGCFRISQIKLSVSAPSPIEPGFYYTLSACDTDNQNDGFYSFNLSEATQAILDQTPSGQDLRVAYFQNLEDAQVEKNELPQLNYVNTTAFEQTIFVRIESEDNTNCIGIGQYLKLIVNPLPEFKIDREFILCLNTSSILVETYENQGNYSYQWFNDAGTVIGSGLSIEISSPGNYSVVATSEERCQSSEKRFFVKASEQPILTPDHILVQDNSNNNTVTILTDNLGVGDYRFALDNGSFQLNNTFEYVEAGIHKVRVKDQNGCGESSLEISVIGFPKFFTPNNDGFNDLWQVDGIAFQPDSTIHIFDRYGKLLYTLKGEDKGWDGSYQGVEMPSSDYWYVGVLEDGRTVKGHFSLIRSEK